MRKGFTIFVTLFFVGVSALGQDSTSSGAKTIDPSKPTNLYTQVNAQLEYQSGKAQDLYGVRMNFQYALNADNLFLIELPFLYNNRTSSFGIGDARIRYFNAVKRNITPTFIAIAPFADISVPLGSFSKGLGTSSWSLAGGVVFGFVASKKLALFPGISYVHITKPDQPSYSSSQAFSTNGVGLQFNASYSFNKSTFLFINPTPAFLSTGGNWNTVWSGELSLNKIIKPNRLKANVFWGPNFTTNVHTFRIGATFFL